MSWHKITLSPSQVSKGTNQSLMLKAAEKYTDNGSPEGFAMFSKMTDDLGEVVYLSPVASEYLQDAIEAHNGEACDTPEKPVTLTAMSLSLIYGKEKDWALLD